MENFKSLLQNTRRINEAKVDMSSVDLGDIQFMVQEAIEDSLGPGGNSPTLSQIFEGIITQVAKDTIETWKDNNISPDTYVVKKVKDLAKGKAKVTVKI